MTAHINTDSNRARRSTWQRGLAAGLAASLVATCWTTGTAWGATGGVPGRGDKSFNPAADAEENHCLSPEGVDANELLGISEQLVVPGACDVVETGEFYVPFTASWIVSSSWNQVPADYTASAPTPVEDFISKVRSMTFTIDAGTRLEHSYRIAAEDIVEVRTLRDFLPTSAPDFPLVLFLAKLPPLSPGDHRIAFSIEMNDRHCDGLGTSSQNCLNAGTTNLGSCAFTVVPRRLPGWQS